MLPDNFACYLVDRDAAGKITAGMTVRTTTDIPEGDVVVRVQFSPRQDDRQGTRQANQQS